MDDLLFAQSNAALLDHAEAQAENSFGDRLRLVAGICADIIREFDLTSSRNATDLRPAAREQADAQLAAQLTERLNSSIAPLLAELLEREHSLRQRLASVPITGVDSAALVVEQRQHLLREVDAIEREQILLECGRVGDVIGLQSFINCPLWMRDPNGTAIAGVEAIAKARELFANRATPDVARALESVISLRTRLERLRDDVRRHCGLHTDLLLETVRAA